MDKYDRLITRRSFLERLALGAAAFPVAARVGYGAPLARTATDRVMLGKSGVRVSRLGMGTGTNGGRVQRGLGQDEFTRMVRHGLDRGVTFFDTADNYDGMHEMLRVALEGVPREDYQIQCKISGGKYENPEAEIDRFRKELGVDYVDSFLIHHVRTRDWPERQKGLMDVLENAKQKEIIRSHGVSIHGLEPLEGAVGVPWIDVALVRVNHNGTHMDGPTGAWAEQGVRDTALGHIRRIHEGGAGVVGMKLIGNGNFTNPDDREHSIRFVMGLSFVDAVVIGFKSPQEIDEAIQRIDAALNA